MFDILTDGLAEWPYPPREDDPRLLLRRSYDDAVQVFEAARDVIEDYRCVRRPGGPDAPERAGPTDQTWTPGAGYREYYDFPAWLKLAARIVSRNSMAISQHGDGETVLDGDHLRVARKVLRVDDRAPDEAILVLLAMCGAVEAAELILASSRQATELLWSEHDRREYCFILRVLANAQRWLIDAYRLRERKEEQSRRSAARGSARKTSEPIREFAQLLRNENPDKSVKWLFDTAVKRVRRGHQAGESPISIGDCMLEIEDERAEKIRLIATKDGGRVGAPAGLSAWQSWPEARKL